MGMWRRLTWLLILAALVLVIIFLFSSTRFLPEQHIRWLRPSWTSRNSQLHSTGHFHYHINRTKSAGTLAGKDFKVDDEIMKWLVTCAFKEDCIAPVGAKLYCGFNFPKDKFGGCHRYDQSLVNILVSNAYSSDRNRYVFEGFAEVDRL